MDSIEASQPQNLIGQMDFIKAGQTGLGEFYLVTSEYTGGVSAAHMHAKLSLSFSLFVDITTVCAD